MLSLALAALLSQTYFSPQEAEAIFSQARQAYSNERYEEAGRGFEKLLDKGYGGADVLFNAGTSYLSAGDLGKATLYLERAKRAAPGAEDVTAHLERARSKQMDKVIGQGGATFIQRLVEATAAARVAWAFLCFWCLGFGFLIVRKLARARRRVFGWASALMLAMAVPTGLLLAAHVDEHRSDQQSIVLAKALPARDGPAASAKVSFEIHAGLKVKEISEADGYVKIRLANGLEGWVEKAGLASI